MIWLALAILAAIAMLLVATVRAPKSTATDAVAHYRAQLGELAEDRARGVIGEQEADAAKLEIERRILKAADGKVGTSSDDRADNLPLIIAATALVAAFALYLLLGRPDLPAKPALVDSPRNQLVQEGDDTTFGDAIEKIEAHLDDKPDDKQGWQLLATTARSVRDFATAARAFQQLSELEPGDINWRVQTFESFLMLGEGQVSPAARLILTDILNRAPEHPAGQYYLGLALMQAGNQDGARAVWTALADRSAPDAPWMQGLRAQLAKLGVAPPKLSDEDMAAVQNMSEEGRQAFIKSMMERLATKLEDQPDDPDGWLMLARSHLAMGDREAAIAALERGLAAVSPGNKAPIKAFLDNIGSNTDP
ncbi:MAG: c-type cytochrome biogenesis protein CcmI [Alphaproteobacteria bacterium]|nr:MAG: c-type cytochrome biogenesis protein CcmI [Alphaproteobacteria bacterium]